MAKTWILDTETKGTGANMVPLDRVTKRSSVAEPVYVPREPARPREPQEPPAKAPHTFKIVDVMTRRTLAEGAGTRAAVEVLADVRSVVDVNVYIWDEDRADWRLLPFADRRALWELARA